MTITYVQAFQPLWYIVDVDGTAAGGAQLFTYDSQTRETPKNVYQDPNGTNAYPNPLIFKANGTAGPIYWKLDDTMPNDNYYYEIYNAQGLLLDSENNFPIGNTGGGGGGGNVTVYQPLTNYIANNQFINHCPDNTGPLTANFLVCPSNHHGFTPSIIPVIGTYGLLGPDIVFTKNNTAANDSISFVDFDLNDAALVPDVTPVRYIRYQCSNMALGETYKSFQFPITQKVKNLSNQMMTFSVWAKVTATPVVINAYCRQYYGSGTNATAESSATRTKIAPSGITLTSSWVQYIFNFTVPPVSGGTLGTTGQQTDDDAIYVQLDMPLGQVCDVQFTKPCLFLGKVSLPTTFDAYDMIDSIDQTPRTGDIKMAGVSNLNVGWIPLNDGTIGNVGSGATTAQGAYVYQLFKTLWDSTDNAQCQVLPSKGSNATADFIAGKTLQLPISAGRAFGNIGGPFSYVNAQTTGANSASISLTADNIAAHVHHYTLASLASGGSLQSGGNFTLQGNSAITDGGYDGSTPLTNPGTPFTVPTISPIITFNAFIKL